MKQAAYIYLMSNRSNTVLYIGVTNDLTRRVAEHKAKINKGFTTRYNADKLVYFETTSSINDAISREKQLKNWKREWKNNLVNKDNSSWNDLSSSIGVDNEMIEAVREYYQGIAGQACNDEETHNDILCHSELDSESHCLEGIAGQAYNDEETNE